MNRKLAFLLLSLLFLASPAAAREILLRDDGRHASTSFALTAPAALACLPEAGGEVRITEHGSSQLMDVEVAGLAPRTTFTVFLLQVPHFPFGMSWYQGDVVTDEHGQGHARFAGIFSEGTAIMALNTDVAPVVHSADSAANPRLAPIHLFHLGLWFNSPADAVAAGCPGATTPFNGDHTAGVQVLSTRGFGDTDGPLGRLKP